MNAALHRRAAKTTGVLWGYGGLLLLLLGMLLLSSFGLFDVSLTTWWRALALTALAGAALWLLPTVDGDLLLSFDRHYVITPLLVAAGLLSYYVLVAPEVRMIQLVVWIVALLYMVGLVGFWAVFLLSLLMAFGYVAAVASLVAGGMDLPLRIDATLAVSFMLITTYAGGVFQRLHRERLEMQQLRRQLAELALTDPLTKLPNRRQFEDILSGEVERVRRYGGECSLAMLDVDFFKTYNDTLGHIAGDTALRELARVMRGQMRVTDVLARYGGEEFAVIMVNTPREEAATAMDRLRAIVEEHPFPEEQVMPNGQLTISAGVASCPEDTTEYNHLVKLADDALYLAKRTGRNQVRSMAPDPEVSA